MISTTINEYSLPTGKHLRKFEECLILVYQILGRELIRLLYLFLGIGVVSCLPLFFSAQGMTWPSTDKWIEALRPLTNIQHLTYIHPDSEVERALFPFIFKPFAMSITVLVLAWILAVGSSFLLALGFQYVSRRGKQAVDACLAFLQSIPDVIFVLVAQMVVIWLSQTFRVTFLSFTGAGDSTAVVLPVLILAIVPTIYLLYAMMESIEQEAAEPYVEFARSKGLSKGPLLGRHVLRNTLLAVAYRSKYVVSMLVSNLLIVEYLFENLGMTQFLFSFTQPSVFLVTAVLFFLPIYLLLKVVEGSTYLITNQRVDL